MEQLSADDKLRLKNLDAAFAHEREARLFERSAAQCFTQNMHAPGQSYLSAAHDHWTAAYLLWIVLGPKLGCTVYVTDEGVMSSDALRAGARMLATRESLLLIAEPSADAYANVFSAFGFTKPVQCETATHSPMDRAPRMFVYCEGKARASYDDDCTADIADEMLRESESNAIAKVLTVEFDMTVVASGEYYLMPDSEDKDYLRPVYREV